MEAVQRAIVRLSEPQREIIASVLMLDQARLGRRTMERVLAINSAALGHARKRSHKLGTRTRNPWLVGQGFRVLDLLRKDFSGRPCRIRTCDPLIKSQLLCQLS